MFSSGNSLKGSSGRIGLDRTNANFPGQIQVVAGTSISSKSGSGNIIIRAGAAVKGGGKVYLGAKSNRGAPSGRIFIKSSPSLSSGNLAFYSHKGIEK